MSGVGGRLIKREGKSAGDVLALSPTWAMGKFARTEANHAFKEPTT